MDSYKRQIKSVQNNILLIKVKMIKIKTEVNPKLLQNFSNQAFPDVTIITQTSRYNLTLAYLIIDSEYFNQISSSVSEIDLSNLPEKPLVQVLRALYGDQLIAYSIAELQQFYKIIDFLGIQQYKTSIVQQILKNKQLMENLEILEFCTRNNLIVEQINKTHIDNKLRALQNNKNFLQLNKISLNTLIRLLLAYYEQVEQGGATVINNILQNYFNRNNMKPAQFFQEHQDVETLLNIWQQFHHTLHIQRKPRSSNNIISNTEYNGMRKSGIQKARSEMEMKKIKQQQAIIEDLNQKLQQQQKEKGRLNRQLFSLKNQVGKLKGTRRIPSNPVQPMQGQDDISIIQTAKMSNKELMLKSIKSQTQSNQASNTKTTKYIVNNKLNFDGF